MSNSFPFDAKDKDNKSTLQTSRFSAPDTKTASSFESFKKPEGSTASAAQTTSFASQTAKSQFPTSNSWPNQNFSRPSASNLAGQNTSTNQSAPNFKSQASKQPNSTQQFQSSRPATPSFGQNKPTFGQTPSFGQNRPTFGQTQSQAPSFGQNRPAFGQNQSPAPSFTASSLHSAAGFNKDIKISDEEFRLLRDFIYRQCGIFIAENRKYLVENRLSCRLKELHLNNYNEYYKYLKFDVNKDKELNQLFVLVTTNETSFFRNPPQLQVFQDHVLNTLVASLSKQGQRRLRIWSAGCSTGEEPYTLAIIIHETLKNELPSWDIKITANDLSTQVLQAARSGIYNEYSLRTTPKEYIAKYFVKDGQVYKIKDELKRMITFGQINLSNREQLKRVENSHIVFCRNVIIYFDDDMKRKVINAFYDNLIPGGALLIGHSETLHNICRSFVLEHHPGCIVYRKQA